jgi:CheY-specific phosphatase CheX
MDKRLEEPYFSSARKTIKQIAGLDIEECEDKDLDNGEIISYGVGSIINFTGKIKGRFMIDLEPDLAFLTASKILGRPCDNLKDKDFIAAVAKLNNIIATDANGYINDTYSLELRLAAPVAYTGKSVILLTPKVFSSTLLCKTSFGRIKLNIGFQGGLE